MNDDLVAFAALQSKRIAEHGLVPTVAYRVLTEIRVSVETLLADGRISRNGDCETFTTASPWRSAITSPVVSE